MKSVSLRVRMGLISVLALLSFAQGAQAMLVAPAGVLVKKTREEITKLRASLQKCTNLRCAKAVGPKGVARCVSSQCMGERKLVNEAIAKLRALRIGK